jgi:hypothetical protein
MPDLWEYERQPFQRTKVVDPRTLDTTYVRVYDVPIAAVEDATTTLEDTWLGAAFPFWPREGITCDALIGPYVRNIKIVESPRKDRYGVQFTGRLLKPLSAGASTSGYVELKGRRPVKGDTHYRYTTRGVALTKTATGIPILGGFLRDPDIADSFNAAEAGVTVATSGTPKTTLTATGGTPFTSSAEMVGQPILIGSTLAYITAWTSTVAVTIDRAVTATTATLKFVLCGTQYSGRIQLDDVSEPGRIMVYAQADRTILQSEGYL